MRLFPAVLLISAACADEPTSPSMQAVAPRASTGTLTATAAIVFADETIPANGIGLIESAGGVVTSRFDSIGVVFAVNLTAAALETLATDPSIAGVALDRVLNWLPGVRIDGVLEAEGVAPANHQDPTKAGRWPIQWNMRQIQADKAWAAGYFSNSGVRVAILDTGIDYTNRELTGIVDLALSKSFVPDDPVLPTDHPIMDLHFHGTHVGSSVVTNNRTVAGVAPHTKLIGVKVLSFLGSGTFEGVTAGIIYAADIGSHVINMSLGAALDLNEAGVPELVAVLKRAIRYAEKRGTLVISAAGNDSENLDDPAAPYFVPCEVSSICVSATGPLLQQNFDQPASYTNYGVSAIEVAAPGGNFDPVNGQDQNEDLILGACSTQTTQPGLAPCRTSRDGVIYFYAFAAGTSMATPHVSGVAAMIKANAPMLKTNALKNRIIDFSDDLGAPGLDPFYGYGRVNVFRSLTKN